MNVPGLQVPSAGDSHFGVGLLLLTMTIGWARH